MTTLPRPTTERVIAERDGSGWLVMWPSGDVRWYPDKLTVQRACRGRLGDAAWLVTVIEWRDPQVPA